MPQFFEIEILDSFLYFVDFRVPDVRVAVKDQLQPLEPVFKEDSLVDDFQDVSDSEVQQSVVPDKSFCY